MPRLTYQQLIEKHLKILKGLQYKSGLFAASQKGAGIDYDKSWLRDNFYETIAFEVLGDWDTVEKTYDALIRLFLKHEEKIDWAIANKPQATYQHIHARFNPETFDEIWDEWGNKQNDAVGCILFRIGELEAHHKRSILKTEHGVRITQKLVRYLEIVEYWQAPDNGVWEINEELHASSVGACIAGLKSIKRLPQIEVPDWIIAKGEESLKNLLPRESQSKFVDLALLSLIWPYDVVDEGMRNKILENVEYHLLRIRGVIRFKGDYFYNKNPDGVSEEAEWTFGLSWLAIIYEKLDNKPKADELVRQAIATDTAEGMPELYFSNSPEYNDHTPLGWSESLFIVALYGLERMEGYDPSGL